MPFVRQTHIYILMLLSDEGPTLGTLHFTFRVAITPNIFYLDLNVSEHCLLRTLRLFHYMLSACPAQRLSCLLQLSHCLMLVFRSLRHVLLFSESITWNGIARSSGSIEMHSNKQNIKVNKRSLSTSHSSNTSIHNPS